MSNHQLTTILNTLITRSTSAKLTGGDGFVSASLLTFDVGLNTRTVRRVLDQEVATGTLERRSQGQGRGYSYRPAEQN